VDYSGVNDCLPSMITVSHQKQKSLLVLPLAIGWWSGVVVSALGMINKVNLRQARLVLRWVTMSGSIPGASHLFRYVTNQPPKVNSAFHPSGVGKWVPASAGKAKAGMVHSVSRFTLGLQVKLWDPLRTRAIPERLRGVFTTRRYIQIHVYLLVSITDPYWDSLVWCLLDDIIIAEHGIDKWKCFTSSCIDVCEACHGVQ